MLIIYKMNFYLNCPVNTSHCVFYQKILIENTVALGYLTEKLFVCF